MEDSWGSTVDWFDTDGDGWLESAFGDLNADGYHDVMPDEIGGYAYDTEFNPVYDTFVTEGIEIDSPTGDLGELPELPELPDIGAVIPTNPIWSLPSPW